MKTHLSHPRPPSLLFASVAMTPVTGITRPHAVSGGRESAGAIYFGNRKTMELLRESDV